MNMLQTISNTNNDALTMSTLTIAELTGKLHKNVMADVRNMFEQLGTSAADFSASQTYGNNNTREVYNLDKKHTLCLVSGYNVQLRMVIIDRWDELETKQAKPKTPPTYATALLEAGRLALELENAEEQLALAAPKVEFYDSFVDAKELLTMEEAAKHLSMGRNKFMDYLRSIKALTNANLPVQRLIDDCKFQVKYTPWKSGNKQGTQHTPMLTAKGLLLLKKRMLRDGIITE
jgi:anti-repressor protein